MQENYNLENILVLGRNCAYNMKDLRREIEKMIEFGENIKSKKIQDSIKLYERSKRDLIYFAQLANNLRNN